MEKSLNLPVVIFFLIVSTLSRNQALAQLLPKIEDGQYVVVGSFKIVNNAIAYSRMLTAKGVSATAEKDVVTGLNYVHLGKENNRGEAITKVLALRQEKQFKDAWVKTILTVPFPQVTSTTAAITNVTEPLFELPEIERPPATITQYEISNTEVFLHLYNSANDKMIDGTVEIIDTERSRLIEKTKGNNYYVLPDPKSRTKKITLIGDVFGYRKVQNEISYPIAAADSLNPNLEIIGTIVMIRFDMVRYAKGDINVLYNVYFYNDASVMQPESRYELNNLLEMMQENLHYRIRLHGHSNGNYTGKIFEPGSDKNLFDFKGATETFGSAKELSFKRASVIKQYLVSNGIGEDRIEIKSWGGKKPLYDKNSANAKKNVRVEVEILAE
jgi:outer membrane protein OmpA-like peptidoglycan-associated protein